MLKTIALPAALAGAVLAGFASTASAVTLGELLDTGQLTPAAVEQLISGTGIDADEARAVELDELVAIKWQDD